MNQSPVRGGVTSGHRPERSATGHERLTNEEDSEHSLAEHSTGTDEQRRQDSGVDTFAGRFLCGPALYANHAADFSWWCSTSRGMGMNQFTDLIMSTMVGPSMAYEPRERRSGIGVSITSDHAASVVGVGAVLGPEFLSPEKPHERVILLENVRKVLDRE